MTFSSLNSWQSVLFPRFLSESDFKQKTCQTFRAGLRNFAAWCLTNEVAVPDTASLNRWKAFLIDRYQTATARTYLSAVKVFCKWFSQQGFGADIAASVKGIQPERFFRKDCLSEEEMRQMLTCLRKKAVQTVHREGKPVASQYKPLMALRDYMMVLL